jgi:hypothetical protein
MCLFYYQKELDSQQKPSVVQLLGSKPYDPRVKRRPDRRREILDLSNTESSKTVTSAGDLSSCLVRHEGNARPPQTITEYRKRKHLHHQDNKTELRPYQRRKVQPNSAASASAPYEPYNSGNVEQNSHPLLRAIPTACDTTNPDTTREQFSSKKHNLNVSSMKDHKLKDHKQKEQLSTSGCSSAADHDKAKMNEKYLQALA